MPAFNVTGPDGKVYRVNTPDGATQDQAIAYVAHTYYNMGVPQQPTAPQPDQGPLIAPQPAKPQDTGVWGEAKRLGSSALSGLETGLAAAGQGAQKLSEYIPTPVTLIDRLTGQDKEQEALAAKAAAQLRADAARHAVSNPNLAEQVASGVGGFVPIITAGALTGGAGVAPIFAAQGYQEAHDEAVAKGKSDAEAERAGFENAGVQGIIGLLNPGERLAGAATKGLTGAARVAGEVGAHAVGAGALMGGSTLGENIVAQQNYDPTRSVWQGVPESALSGAILGGVTSGGGALLHGGAEWLRNARDTRAETEQGAPADKAATANKTGFTAGASSPAEYASALSDLGAVFETGQMNAGVGERHLSDAFSQDMIRGRLEAAAGDDTEKHTNLINQATDKLTSSLSQGNVSGAADYVSDMAGRASKLRLRQAQNEFAQGGVDNVSDPRLRVWLESKSIVTDYMAEQAKAKAQPGVTVGEPAPGVSPELLQQNAQQAAATDAFNARQNVFQAVAAHPETFTGTGNQEGMLSSALSANGLDPNMTPEEKLRFGKMVQYNRGMVELYNQAFQRGDITQEQRDAAVGQHVDINQLRQLVASENAKTSVDALIQAQRLQDRLPIAQRILDQTTGDPLERLHTTQKELAARGLDPLTQDELMGLLTHERRAAGLNDVFGPSGELEQRIGAGTYPPREGPLEEWHPLGVTGEPAAGGIPAQKPAGAEATGVPVAAPAKVPEAANPHETIASIEATLKKFGMTPESEAFARDPKWAGTFNKYLEAKAAALTEGAPEAPPSKTVKETAVTKPTTETPILTPAGGGAGAGAAPPEEVIPSPTPAEEVPPVPITKVTPGVARGVNETRKGMMGTQMGRPVEGAAELTQGMQDEQKVTSQLNTLRNNNLVSDQDVGEVLNMMRVPGSKEDLNALPPSQQARWTKVLSLQADVNDKAEQLQNATAPKEKAQLKAAIEQGNAALDAARSDIANAAGREAQARVATRQEKLRQIDAAYKAGEITARERDMQKAALRVETPMAPRLATDLVTGERTESAQHSLRVAQETQSAHAVLQDIINRGGPLAEIAQRILAVAPDMRVLVVDSDTIRLVARREGERLEDVPNLEGVYDPRTKTVYLNQQMTLDHIPLHEIVHGLTSWHIENSTPIGKELQHLWKLFEFLAPEEMKAHYGFTDAHEFASEVYTNPEFRKVIDELTPKPTKAEPQPRTLLQRFVDAVKSIFGKGPKAEAEAAPAIDYVEKIMSVVDRAASEIGEATEARPGPSVERGTGPGAHDEEVQALRDELRKKGPTSSVDATLGAIAENESKLQKLITDEKTKNVFDLEASNSVDRWLAKAYGVTRLPFDMSVRAVAELVKNKKNGMTAKIDRDYVDPLFKGLAALKVNLSDLDMYLWARGAVDRNKIVGERNSRFLESGSGLTDAQAKGILAVYDKYGMTPTLEKAAKLHDALRDYTQNEYVKSGLLTKQQADELRKAQPNYAALKGHALDGDMYTAGDQNPHDEATFRQNLGINPAVIGKAMGRGSMPFSPTINLIADAKALSQRVAKNEVGQKLLENVLAEPDLYKDVVRAYTDANPKVRVIPSERVEYPDGIPIRSNMRKEADDYLVVKRNGNTHYLDFQPTEAGAQLKRMFENLSPQDLGKFMGVVNKWGAVFRSLNVQRSPLFLDRMIIRDTDEALKNAKLAVGDKSSPAFGNTEYAKEVGKNLNPMWGPGKDLTGALWNHIWKREPKSDTQAHTMLLIDQMLDSGGASSHTAFRTAEDTAEHYQKFLEGMSKRDQGDMLAIGKDRAKIVLGAVENFVRMGELRVRLAAYKAALDTGMSEKEAAYMAANSYINTSRMGERGPMLGALYWFATAKVNTLRIAAKMPLSPIGRKLMASQIALGAMLAAWNIAMGSDDDDKDGRPNWMDVPDHDKLYSYILRYGHKSDQYIKVPAAFITTPYLYLGEKMAEYGYGATNHIHGAIHMGAALTDVARGWGELLSPVPLPRGKTGTQIAASLTPTLVAPFAQLAANRNFFDSPIYKDQYKETKAASASGREGTPEFYKELAGKVNDLTFGSGSVPGLVDLHPESYKHLIESYGGGAFQFAKQIDDFASGKDKDTKTLAERLPLVKGFIGQGAEYAPMAAYYKNTAEGVPSFEALLNQRKEEPLAFRESKEKYPFETDPRVLGAYQMASTQLTELSRARAQMLKAVKDPQVRKERAKMFSDREERIFSRFNKRYYDVRAEYDEQ